MPERDRELQLFSPDDNGVFAGRPNRFVILADIGGKEVRAHCPNPGRMQEILLPGTEVILERAASPTRSTSHTFVAAVHRGEIIALHSTRTNEVARVLILPKLFPNALNIKPEAVFGGSRFDFSVTTENGIVLVEVKSCTLCENGVAMFPDAPTTRGLKHLIEMAELVQTGVYRDRKIAGGLVLFVVGHPNPTVFIPNIHTDPLFSETLLSVSRTLTVTASTISVTPGGSAKVEKSNIPVEYGPVSLIAENRGIYLLLLFLPERATVPTGGLGSVTYKKGWYVYVGSAKKGLTSRIHRHLSRRKRCHWHIDYLTLAAASVRAYPIYTDRDLECELAADVRDAGGIGVDRFGSSDCGCKSHLFHFETDPFGSRAFVDVLFSYRHVRGLENFLA